MVVMYENISNRFWNADSTVEKLPRCSVSTSYIDISRALDDTEATYVLNNILRAQVISPKPNSTQSHSHCEPCC